ncbi:hypothetical protein IWZ00DRAFT_203430 [Phyllosticta capitalensis]|uniref:Secreted protein n=1 Tax=Phyllosticta capitalensis TaxID=121624 RepID=A0ABR1YT81_9PEZI
MSLCWQLCFLLSQVTGQGGRLTQQAPSQHAFSNRCCLPLCPASHRLASASDLAQNAKQTSFFSPQNTKRRTGSRRIYEAAGQSSSYIPFTDCVLQCHDRMWRRYTIEKFRSSQFSPILVTAHQRCDAKLDKTQKAKSHTLMHSLPVISIFARALHCQHGQQCC